MLLEEGGQVGAVVVGKFLYEFLAGRSVGRGLDPGLVFGQLMVGVIEERLVVQLMLGQVLFVNLFQKSPDPLAALVVNPDVFKVVGRRGVL